ncbi:MAG: transaldolase family protein [Prochlorococcus sp.]|jgi:transaldolase|tara:strand:+ start:325 stop:990 length:666 start_codon:yes stop_codon:yes gene_type:complete
MNEEMEMKIFLDTAETDVIAKHFATGLVDGVTTNPTLIRKSGRNPEEVYQEIKDIGVQDISMEVIGDKLNMISEGRRLAKKFGKVATIKVPCTPNGLAACKELVKDHIRVNVTLIFDAAQAVLSAKAGATYVSPFVGRLDDNSIAGLDLIRDISELYSVQKVKETKIISASIRDVKSVSQSFTNGANIVTMPAAVFEKMYNHVLTDKGLDLFDQDWNHVVQ